MKDGFAKVTKAFKKDLKKASQKEKNVSTKVTPTALEELGWVVLGIQMHLVNLKD